LQDPDLIVQRDTVASELSAYRTRLFGLQVDAQNLSTDIASLQHSIAVLRATYAKLVTRFDNLKMDLDETMEELLRASEDFSVYNDTLTKLDSDIIYRVLADQTLYHKNRKFVKRFDTIFANN